MTSCYPSFHLYKGEEEREGKEAVGARRERERGGEMSTSSAARASRIDLIVFGILSRVPAKSVTRFKCVCKYWFAMVARPSFRAAHTRCNPLTASGIIIQHPVKGPLFSFSVEGGASPVLPDSWLMSANRLFGAVGGFRIRQHCNGLLLCRDRPDPLTSRQFLLNPTTMRCKQIPDLPSDLWAFHSTFMLAFDPSISLQYRIVCLSWRTFEAFDSTDPRYHVAIFSSDTGAWEFWRETMPGDKPARRPVYWNGALNWVTAKRLLVSFDVEQQVVKTTAMPPLDGLGMTLYLGESRGHLHMIEVAADDSPLEILDGRHFRVFEMGKNDSSWSLLYEVYLDALMDVYPQDAPHDKNLLGMYQNQPELVSPVFFARGEKEEDDKLYLSCPWHNFCYNLADRTCRDIIPMNLGDTLGPYWFCLPNDGFPFAHSLFSP